MPQGSRIALSPARLGVLELMRLSQRVPLVTAERTTDLSLLVETRRDSPVKFSWTVLFMKAFGLVSARRPELRRMFMSFPYRHLYQHDTSIANVVVEREHDGERLPLFCRFWSPERQSLMELQQRLWEYQTTPLESDRTYRKLQAFARLPGFLRRFVWDVGYHWKGRKRAHYFGTFGISSPAAEGAGLTTILSPLTCTLHYGLFDADGRLPMRITFDHRAIDGAPVARALADLEKALLTDILDEVRSYRRVSGATEANLLAGHGPTDEDSLRPTPARDRHAARRS